MSVQYDQARVQFESLRNLFSPSNIQHNCRKGKGFWNILIKASKGKLSVSRLVWKRNENADRGSIWIGLAVYSLAYVWWENGSSNWTTLLFSTDNAIFTFFINKSEPSLLINFFSFASAYQIRRNSNWKCQPFSALIYLFLYLMQEELSLPVT